MKNKNNVGMTLELESIPKVQSGYQNSNQYRKSSIRISINILEMLDDEDFEEAMDLIKYIGEKKKGVRDGI